MQIASKVSDFFSVHGLISLKQLFRHRVHYGHKEGLLHPMMTPYVYGARLGVSIIDLNKTLDRFREALNVTAHVAYRGGIVLFVSNHKETAQMVEKMAMECGEYAHCRPYSSKVLTDSESYFRKVMRLPDLIILMSSFDGVFMDHQIIMDAASTLIPTIGIVDTNSDPRLITYPIPANDDTPCAVKLYCELFKEAILRGKAKRETLANPNQNDVG